MSAIEKAAAMLREEAEAIKASHTLFGDWCGDPTEADYHEMIAAADAAIAERDDLRAKIEAMERQEPVGVVQWIKGWPVVNAHDGVILEPNKPLYALPGAQPATSVPEAVMAALENLDDYIARIEGNDRGACNPINLIRRYLLDAAGVGGSK